ncbi:unnamed protein product [Parnassius apollo]|uniref:(apollo) hypothetical protein n=1 Tax=Parnassius apollo TaxID=110799 RepID=A0A8S3XNL6_PARAO|nr:unnamed protein product [Parnassius apollo]
MSVESSKSCVELAKQTKPTSRSVRGVSPSSAPILRKKVLMHNAASSKKVSEDRDRMDRGMAEKGEATSESVTSNIIMGQPTDKTNITTMKTKGPETATDDNTSFDIEAELGLIGLCKPVHRTDDEWSDVESMSTAMDSVSTAIESVLFRLDKITEDIREIIDYGVSQSAFQNNSGLGTELAIAEIRDKLNHLETYNCSTITKQITESPKNVPIKEQQATRPIKSYAEALTSSRFGLVVESLDPRHTSEDVVNTIKNNIDVVQLGVAKANWSLFRSDLKERLEKENAIEDKIKTIKTPEESDDIVDIYVKQVKLACQKSIPTIFKNVYKTCTPWWNSQLETERRIVIQLRRKIKFANKRRKPNVIQDFVEAKENKDEEENIEHLLIDCPRFAIQRLDCEQKMGMALTINNLRNAINNDDCRTHYLKFSEAVVRSAELENMKKELIKKHHTIHQLKRRSLPLALDERNKLKAEYSEALKNASILNFKEFYNKQGKDDVWSLTNKLLKTKPLTQPPSTVKLRNGYYTVITTGAAKLFLNEYFPDDTPDVTEQQLEARSLMEISPKTTPDPSFTTEEILDCLKAMNPNKSPGPNHLMSDNCLMFAKWYPSTVTLIMNKCLELKYFPKIWKEAYIKIIPKPNKSNNLILLHTNL